MPDLQKDPLRGLSDALLGQVLPGSEGRRYPLRERIGEGGQGWVFRATWNGSIDVVVKVLRPDAATSEALARFQREAQVLRTLAQQPTPNPHVVRFYDHAYANVFVPATQSSWDLPFTVLELVEGETLQSAIDRAAPRGIGLERARRVLRHVVLALEDVHARNIVHRDLKPSNILLTSAGTREIAKVTDFGLAKLLDPGMQRTTHLAGATVGYAPPEQFEPGNLRVGRHTDVFSLAAVFYELVTGRAAFPFHPNAHPLMVLARILHEARPAFARVSDALPPELAERPDIVAAVDRELSRALSPDPAERHATVTELRDALESSFASLSGASSLPLSSAGGSLIVRRASAPPGTLDAQGTPIDPAAARPSNPLLVTAPLSNVAPTVRSLLSAGPHLAWRAITPPFAPGMFGSIAVSPTGDSAAGIGPRGVGVWRRGAGWTALGLPHGFDPSGFGACGWHGDRVILAGASSVVVSLSGSAAPFFWHVETPHTSYRSVFVDGAGVVLAGARSTPGGSIGVLAEIDFREEGGTLSRMLDVPGSTELFAAARMGDGILACGARGTLVFALPGAPARSARICDPALSAVLPSSHDTAVVVGGGGYVFTVRPTLEAQLEPIDTKRDLLALASGIDGSLWCAGAAGRILRRERETGRWIRAERNDVGCDVRALFASPDRLLAFTDDGGVFEGVAQSGSAP